MRRLTVVKILSPKEYYDPHLLLFNWDTVQYGAKISRVEEKFSEDGVTKQFVNMPWRASNFYDYSPSVDEIAFRKSLTRDSDTFKSILANSRDNFYDAAKDRADNIPDAENSNVTAESDKSVSGSTSSSNSTGQGQTEERVPTASSSNSTGQGQTEERVPTVVAGDRS